MHRELEDGELVEFDPEGLVEFLYLLGRDHLPLGVIRGIITAHVLHNPEQKREYSDEELEAWARLRADELLGL